MGSENVSLIQSDGTVEYRAPRKHAMETRPALLVRRKRVTPRDEQIIARILPVKHVIRDLVKSG
jgi:transposase-like protein